MSKLTRRKFLTGVPAVAVAAVVGAAVTPPATASAGPALVTLPFGLWRPDLPETIPLAPKEPFIGHREDFRGQAVSEGTSPSQVNESARKLERIISRYYRPLANNSR